MLDQNTDRMWYVIGAVIVGAAIILILNGTAPELFASVADTFKDKTSEVTGIVDDISPTYADEDIVFLQLVNELDHFYPYDYSLLTITTGHTVAAWNSTRAVRVQISGGDSYIKAWRSFISNRDQVVGRKYVYTVPVKNIGSTPVKVINNKESAQVIAPGEETTLRFVGTGGGGANVQLELHTVNSIDDDVDVLLGGLKLGYIKEKD